MIKPRAFKSVCKDCGYSKVFAPKSDALSPFDLGFSKCPKCGSKNVVRKEPDFFDKLTNPDAILDIFRKF